MLRVSVSHMPGCKSVCWAVRWDADHSSCFCVQVYDYPFSMRLHLATTLVFCKLLISLLTQQSSIHEQVESTFCPSRIDKLRWCLVRWIHALPRRLPGGQGIGTGAVCSVRSAVRELLRLRASLPRVNSHREEHVAIMSGDLRHRRRPHTPVIAHQAAMIVAVIHKARQLPPLAACAEAVLR